jgi:hypothetical protein
MPQGIIWERQAHFSGQKSVIAAVQRLKKN